MKPSKPDTEPNGAAGQAATAFFESVREACRAAESRAGLAIRRFVIGGYAVEIRFAGDALLPHLAPALEHLAAPAHSGKPDLTICAWESESTNTPMPPRPWGSDDCIARGDIRGFGNERIDLALSADVGAVSLLDAEENLGIFWIRAAGHIPTYERGAPLRSILHWWMRRRGRLLIHAGAIGREGKGALLVGRGGSGKSTAALTCMLNGWRYLSDDYCLLAAEGEPRAYSLYNTAKLTADHLKNFPALQPAVSNPGELGGEKALLFIHDHMPDRAISDTRVNMVLLPRVSGDPETRIRPASPTAALRALAPSSLFQIPGTGRFEFQALADFVKRIPCFHLALGTDMDKIPDVLWKAFPQ
ncbi:MAG: serine kinase [Anaerolineales bacterium]